MRANDQWNFFKVLLFGLIVTLTVSCNKDDVKPEITISDLVGSWTATSMVMTNNADSGQKFGFVENGGEIRFTLLANAGVRTWITIDTFSDEWDAKMTITGNTLTTVPVEGSRVSSTFTFELDGDVLALTNVDDSFDFTLSGKPEVSATSVGQFELR